MTPSRRSSLKRQKGGFMKRRKFIEATLLAVPAASSAAGMRLYGTPGSVAQLAKAQESEKLLLPISKSGLPPAFWSKLKSVRSEERRVGTECVSTCQYRRYQYN